MGLSRLQTSIPFLADIQRIWISVLMPGLRASHRLQAAAGLCAALSGYAQASVSVTLSSSALPSLQDQFVADATRQYEGILTKSLTANVWTFKISSKKPSTLGPCSDNFVDGFAFGIEDERKRDLKILKPYQVQCSTPSDDIYQQWFSTPTAMP